MIIKTGYYSWHEFGKNNSFYPDDMPEEWCLTFYANEIECTQISLSSLNNIEDTEELFEDLTDQFNLIVQCDDLDQWPVLKVLLENDDINLAVLQCSELCKQEWSDQLAHHALTCFVESDKNILSFKDGIVGQQLIKNKFNIMYIDELLGLKQMRGLIEQCIGNKDHDEHYVLLNPKVYKPSAAGEIRLMIEMMGY